MHKYEWFYHRLRSMTVPEVMFRAGQFVQKKTDRRHVGWQPVVRLTSLPEPLLPFEPLQTPVVTFSPEQPVFKHKTTIDEPVDWHLDVKSGLRFPLTYAKDIDVRSGCCGSAKYAWEINRLLFLPQLAVQYRQTGDQRFLAQFIELNRSWFTDNPYLVGVNWYSNIEVNIRLINWFISWNILDASALANTDDAFRTFVESEWLPVIYQHCTYSHRNPSYHSSGNNHLIAEYAGLFIASSFWGFPESAVWRLEAKAGMEREMQEQHSPHGVNREEAAEYIQFITDFFLLAQVVGERSGNAFSNEYMASLKQIFTYIAQFLDCKGVFPRYGDEDDGRVLLLDDQHPHNNFESLLRSGAVLFGEPLFKQRSANRGELPRFDLKNFILFGSAGKTAFDAISNRDDLSGSKLYAEDGHFIFRKQERTGNSSQLREIYIHADAAPLGFLSIAAHGHADALSFMMHVDGQVMLADPGTYSYQTDPIWRNYFVSTRAHNTVCIDGQNQSFQAGALLWLNHYKTQVVSSSSNDLVDEVTATHDGYARLHCKHQRTFQFEKPSETLSICDLVENYGKQARSVEVMFHLGPDVEVVTLSRNKFALTHPGTERRVWLTIASALRTEVITGQLEPLPLGWYSEGFYRNQPTTTIRTFLTLDAGRNITLKHQLRVLSPVSVVETEHNRTRERTTA